MSKSAIEVYDAAIKELLGFETFIKRHASVLADLEPLVARIGGELSIGYHFGSLRGALWHIGGVARDDGKPVTREQVAAAIRGIRRLGFKRTLREDYEEIQRRSWYFSRGEGAERQLIVFSAFFSAAGQTCKFVQVGVEEKPVYELRCDGTEMDL